MDAIAFLAEIEQTVINPVRQTEALLQSRPYVTRLFTTLSADEMTLDPVFEFNPDLGDVSNVHTATRTFECQADLRVAEAPSRVELPNGQVVRVAGGAPWPFSAGSGMPANAVVLQADTRGEGTVVSDNSTTIRSLISAQNDQVPAVGSGSDGACGCRSRGKDAPRSGISWLAIALIGLCSWLRRAHPRRCPRGGRGHLARLGLRGLFRDP